jgi:hypothetical protein
MAEKDKDVSAEEEETKLSWASELPERVEFFQRQTALMLDWCFADLSALIEVWKKGKTVSLRLLPLEEVLKLCQMCNEFSQAAAKYAELRYMARPLVHETGYAEIPESMLGQHKQVGLDTKEEKE